eukprot:7103872-Pyramimonas_sp.AAC.1
MHAPSWFGQGCACIAHGPSVGMASGSGYARISSPDIRVIPGRRHGKDLHIGRLPEASLPDRQQRVASKRLEDP